MGWGGQEIRVLSECSWFNSYAPGIDCQVLTARGAQMVDRSDYNNVLIETGPIGSKSLQGLRFLSRYLKNLSPDIIVTHSSTDSWLVAIAVQVSGVKTEIVRMRHVSAVIKPNFMTKWLYSRARFIITTSDAIKTHVEQTLNIAAHRVVSIPTGLDVSEKFAPTQIVLKKNVRNEFGIPKDALLIGMLSTLRSWKGHQTALEALTKIENVLLIIIGDGPQEQFLKNKVSSLGLDGKVVFMGYRSDPEHILPSLDIFIQPSFANEGLSQSLMQAMSVGLPVIAADISGLNEMVDHGVDGLLIAPKDPIALSNAIVSLAENSELRADLGRAARERAIKSFSIDAMGQKMLTIFKRSVSAS